MGEKFAGKVAFVTGAASGIGRECALRFAAQGAAVAVCDMNADGGNATVADIEAAGGKALFVNMNAGDAASVEAAVKATVEAFGRLDFAVNNAGIGGAAGTAGEYGLDDWAKVIDVNLNGVFYSLRFEVPEMKKAGGGVIVNVSSILGLVGWGMAPAYVAAKHGVMGLTKAAALDHAADNIRVVAVNPGFIETPLLTNAGIEKGNDLYNFIASKHAMNRLGTAEEVAAAIVWLCDPEASFVTGTGLAVDGGFTAQ